MRLSPCPLENHTLTTLLQSQRKQNTPWRRALQGRSLLRSCNQTSCVLFNEILEFEEGPFQTLKPGLWQRRGSRWSQIPKMLSRTQARARQCLMHYRLTPTDIHSHLCVHRSLSALPKKRKKGMCTTRSSGSSALFPRHSLSLSPAHDQSLFTFVG